MTVKQWLCNLLTLCAVSSFAIILPYFFEENGSIVTVNSISYIEMIRNLCPELHSRRINCVFSTRWHHSAFCTWIEPCSLSIWFLTGIFSGPFTLLSFKVFFFGVHMSMLINTIYWLISRKPSIEIFSWSIIS